MWTFFEMYMEERVLHNDNVLKISNTLHSQQRKYRSNNQGRSITDKEILALINKLLPTIQTEYKNGNIPSNGKIWLYDSKSRLNVVIEYKLVNTTKKQKITILTVMRHNNFHPSKDTTKKIIL